MKKRHTYGTILIDMETRKVIDLIESREVEVVSEWLKKFKNINFFNRDGSQTYAKAISEIHLLRENLSLILELLPLISIVA